MHIPLLLRFATSTEESSGCSCAATVGPDRGPYVLSPALAMSSPALEGISWVDGGGLYPTEIVSGWETREEEARFRLAACVQANTANTEHVKESMIFHAQRYTMPALHLKWMGTSAHQLSSTIRIATTRLACTHTHHGRASLLGRRGGRQHAGDGTRAARHKRKSLREVCKVMSRLGCGTITCTTTHDLLLWGHWLMAACPVLAAVAKRPLATQSIHQGSCDLILQTRRAM